MDISDLKTGKTETCVEGDEPTCARAGGRWEASSKVARCCLPKSDCTLGDAATCATSHGIWTGKYCCVAPARR